MYDVRADGKKVNKQLQKLLLTVSEEVEKRFWHALENYPYPSPTYGNNRNIPTKIEKKGKVYCYEITGGDRILYLIQEKPLKAVLIIFAGNDKDEIRFLKKGSK